LLYCSAFFVTLPFATIVNSVQACLLGVNTWV
jgi:hypothetical protein